MVTYKKPMLVLVGGGGGGGGCTESKEKNIMRTLGQLGHNTRETRQVS